MSQHDRDRAMERMATDAAFARAVGSDPGALAGYDLTEDERLELSSLRTEAPVAARAAQPVALQTRRSKSSMLGIGAVTAVAAAGAATYGVIRLQPPSYNRSMSVDSGAQYAINSIALGSGGDIAVIRAPGAGSSTENQLTIGKPVDGLTPQLLSDATSGKPIDALLVTVQKSGSAWLRYQGSNCLVKGVQYSSASSSSPQTQSVTLQCQSVDLVYVNGGP
jgi:type VI protein secretion system component Hcp